MTDDEHDSAGDGEHLDAARVRAIAERLLAAALDRGGGEGVDDALGEVRPGDALDVLGAVLREFAVLVAAQQLRSGDPQDRVHAAPEDGDEREQPAGMPADPWHASDDAATNTLEEAGALFEALAEQRTVADLFRAIGSLDESEITAIVLERSLAAMAERQRPSGSRR
jgi:hypothetical protein